MVKEIPPVPLKKDPLTAIFAAGVKVKEPPPG